MQTQTHIALFYQTSLIEVSFMIEYSVLPLSNSVGELSHPINSLQNEPGQGHMVRVKAI